jgi:hypothetical protein
LIHTLLSHAHLLQAGHDPLHPSAFQLDDTDAEDE